ncbi:AhpC/TSA family protein [Pedobacter sp. MC2016-14]|uniref:TlpA disulfide reductase family protein n=1 Tax=Pedobacter sp. MC2016-14 TaxID=2897327 RepID=UPI001E420AB0|nr:TlpA disulfide reductase family protein [Pedobacter sp. MC2016-14]MCD0489230.1 AhpC/TSA family protein [Pedobacter sp. MC2016-14]
MKKLLLSAMALVPALGFAQSSDYTLTAKVNALKVPAKAYLSRTLDGKRKIDSAEVVNGAFTFKGQIAEPTRAELMLDHTGAGLKGMGRNADMKVVYLEKGTIVLKGKDSVQKAIVTGSKFNAAYDKYTATYAAIDDAMEALNAEYAAAPAEKKKDQAFMAGLRARYSELAAKKVAAQTAYIKQNPDSYFSATALTEIAGSSMDVSKIEPLYKGLSAGVRGNAVGIALGKGIESARATSIGAMAPEFTQNDVNDKPVKLSDFKGKYVLIDFWASWCGPCRAENPSVVRAYNEYKDKNFTVLGVSLDQPGKKDAWLAAIEKDGLTWTQVSDLQFWNNAVAKQYGVRSIPQNYLVDPAGKIVAKNLRGEALDKKLAELLGAKSK